MPTILLKGEYHPMPYQHDIFISYTRDAPIGPWVRRYFAPQLEERLSVHLPEDPVIFLDQGIPVGTVWSVVLEDALKNSKILVPVWSPKFFRSPWCMAEWESFELRKAALPACKTPLVYPVKFADGTHFPPAAQNVQCRDLSPWGRTGLAFDQSLDFLDFQEEMDKIAQDLAVHLVDRNFPEHDPTWMVKQPSTAATASLASIALPRM